jgi:hypothetical protein
MEYVDPVCYVMPIIKAIRKYASQGEGLSLLGCYPVALGKLEIVRDVSVGLCAFMFVVELPNLLDLEYEDTNIQ